MIENLLPLALSSSKIVGEDVTISQGNSQEKGDVKLVDSSGDRVDYYIRASIKNSFSKVTWSTSHFCFFISYGFLRSYSFSGDREHEGQNGSSRGRKRSGKDVT